MKKMLSIAIMMAGIMACPSAFAAGAAAIPPLKDDNCSVNETANLSVTLEGKEGDANVIKNKIDGKIQEIKQLAKAAGLSKFEQQNMNYNINGRNNNDSDEYTYNGNVRFTLQPADKGASLMEVLHKKGYKANLSVNSYNNCNSARNIPMIPPIPNPALVPLAPFIR